MFFPPGASGKPGAVVRGRDLIAVFDEEEQIRTLSPDFDAIADLDALCVVITAPGKDCDFVSRCFAPSVGVDEDLVTGSAHCGLAPYWARRLGRSRLFARQRSRRGGALYCEVRGDRVLLEGNAVDYLRGEIVF